ncbi:hypothetical protein PMAYCL1PPCAC_21875, partial [Pristionchus mayeri]
TRLILITQWSGRVGSLQVGFDRSREVGERLLLALLLESGDARKQNAAKIGSVSPQESLRARHALQQDLHLVLAGNQIQLQMVHRRFGKLELDVPYSSRLDRAVRVATRPER